MDRFERSQYQGEAEHLSVEQLNAFVLGHLDDDASSEIERHLLACESCSSRLTHSPDESLVTMIRQSNATSAAEQHPYLAPAQEPDELGRLGSYRVLRVLGFGGMGLVFLAEDPDLQRRVALKVMKPALAAKPNARERFVREARSMAKLSHPRIATIFQVGQDRGVPFLAMELLGGESLDARIKREGKLSVAETLRIGREIAEGLAEAHQHGLIHRDIKPANIWLDSHTRGVKLLDFGLARGDLELHRLTESGAVLGTPAYMSPEQARGMKVDARSDLFSLGVVLYRLTTGQMPFRGDSPVAVLTALALERPKPPREINPDIPPNLAALIERLLAKDRNQRPATAQSAADELAAIVGDIRAASVSERSSQTESSWSDLCTAPLTSRLRTAPLWSRLQTAPLRSRLGWLAASLLLLAGVAAGIVVIVRDRHGKKVQEIEVPPGGSVEIRAKSPKLPQPQPKKNVRILPEPLAPLAPGEPLTPFALVIRPTKLSGVRSWSIVPRQTWTPASVAYRPDGKRLAVGSWDNAVHIWDVQTGRLVQVLLAPGAAAALAWSPDGRVLAVGSGLSKRATFLYDADSGRLLRGLQSPDIDYITALAWSADGTKLRAWGEEGRRCYTWEAADGTLLHAHKIVCRRATFSADGRRVAGVVDDKLILAWSPETGKQVSHLSAPVSVWGVSWSPDGKLLAGAAQDGLHIWDVKTQKETYHYPKNASRTDPPAWSPDGSQLAFNLGNQEGVAVIEPAADAVPRRLDDPYNALLAWSPDGATIARLNGGHTVGLYDAASGKRLHSLSVGQAFLGFAWSPDGRTLAAAAYADTYLISATTGQLVAEWKGAAWPLAWSPDGKLLAASGTDNKVLLRDADGKVRSTQSGHSGKITSISWSPDSKRLASTAAGEKRVLIWDTAKAQCEREMGPFGGAAEQGKWSADGRLLAFNVEQLGWHIWDIDKGQLANDPSKWKLAWFNLAPDGRSALVAPNANDKYRLRDLSSGKDGAQLPREQALLLARPTWSAAGRMLAVSLYSAVELWPADLSKPLHLLQPGLAPSHVAFSADGKRLVSLAGERLYFWETGSGQPRGIVMLGPRNNGLTLAPDGNYAGNDKVERSIVVVVQRDDGTQELLEPAEFEHKYGFKNDAARVRLMKDPR